MALAQSSGVQPSHESVDELAEQVVGYLDELPAEEVLRLSGLRSSKFDRLPT